MYIYISIVFYCPIHSVVNVILASLVDRNWYTLIDVILTVAGQNLSRDAH